MSRRICGREKVTICLLDKNSVHKKSLIYLLQTSYVDCLQDSSLGSYEGDRISDDSINEVGVLSPPNNLKSENSQRVINTGAATAASSVHNLPKQLPPSFSRVTKTHSRSDSYQVRKMSILNVNCIIQNHLPSIYAFFVWGKSYIYDSNTHTTRTSF